MAAVSAHVARVAPPPARRAQPANRRFMASNHHRAGGAPGVRFVAARTASRRPARSHRRSSVAVHAAATFPELTDDESLADIAKSAAKGESLSICVPDARQVHCCGDRINNVARAREQEVPSSSRYDPLDRERRAGQSGGVLP